MSMNQIFMTGLPMSQFSNEIKRIFDTWSCSVCRAWISTAFLMMTVCCVSSLNISEVHANEPMRAVLWSELSPDQQALLEKYEKSWSQLLPDRQSVLADASSRWLVLDPVKRQRATERFDRWRKLSPSQREIQRANFEQLKRLSQFRQTQVHAHAAQFEARPIPEQQLLLKRWQGMTSAQRHRDN